MPYFLIWVVVRECSPLQKFVHLCISDVGTVLCVLHFDKPITYKEVQISKRGEDKFKM